MNTLRSRLQNKEYKLWVKGGLCLNFVKDGLKDFAALKSSEFHKGVLDEITKGGINIAGNSVCQNVCISARQTGYSISCNHKFCKAFVDAVVRVGIDTTKGFKIGKQNLGNTDASLWHNSPWELAKLFMNAGQKPTQTNPQETDLSGIINFIDHCKVATNGVQNIQYIDMVRKARNEIMHSSDMLLSSAAFRQHALSMIHLLEDPKFLHSCQSACSAVKQIKQLMTTDFEISEEDHSKMIEDFLEELKKIAEWIQSEEKATQRQIQDLEEELNKVVESFNTLKKRVAEDASLPKRIETNLRQLHQSVEQIKIDLKRAHLELKRRITDVELRQSEDKERIDDVEKEQASLHKRQSEEKKRIDDVEKEQASLHKRQSDEEKRIDDVEKRQAKIEKQVTQTISSAITEEDETRLHEYLREQYQRSTLHVPVLPDCYAMPVTEIFIPVIIIKEKEKAGQTSLFRREGPKGTQLDRGQETNKKVSSYKNIFYRDNVLQKRVFLLGKAGSGKSTFCKHLVAAWCGSDLQMSVQYQDMNELKTQFQYVFYVESRFASESESLLEMILNQLFNDDSFHGVVKHVLKSKPENCLIINDGLDEWKGSTSQPTRKIIDTKGLPSFDGLPNCVTLTTSRPWRIYAINQPPDQTWRLLEIQGIEDVKMLAVKILTALESSEPEEAAKKFCDSVKESHMSEMIQTPLLFLHIFAAWNLDKKLDPSTVKNYCGMLEAFLKGSKGDNRPGETNVHTDAYLKDLSDFKAKWRKSENVLPYCFKDTQLCKQYAGLIIDLGKLAFDLLFHDKNIGSLVFSKQQFGKYLDEKALSVCLRIGILSQDQAPSHGIIKKGRLSFCHKTFQEFLAALWMSLNYHQECEKFHDCCRTVENVLDYEVFIRFSCGLSPRDGADLWRYICDEVLDNSSRMLIKRIERGNTTSYEWNLITIMKAYCAQEARLCVTHESDQQSEPGTNNLFQRLLHDPDQQQRYQPGEYQRFYYLSDLSITDDATKHDVSLVCDLLQQDTTRVKSVTVFGQDRVSQHVIKCMKKMTNVIGIWLVSSRCDDPLSSLPVLPSSRQEFPDQLRSLLLYSWCIKDFRLSFHLQLTLLHLENVYLSHDARVQLTTYLSKSSDLRHLGLISLTCSDDGDSCLPLLDLQRQHRLKGLYLERLSVKGVLLPDRLEREQDPGAPTTSELYIYMEFISMSPKNWRSLAKSIVELPYHMNVRLKEKFNIDTDTKLFISSCLQVTMWENTDDEFWFTKKSEENDISVSGSDKP